MVTVDDHFWKQVCYLATLADDVRTLQKQHFAGHNMRILTECKRKEKELDELIIAMKAELTAMPLVKQSRLELENGA